MQGFTHGGVGLNCELWKFCVRIESQWSRVSLGVDASGSLIIAFGFASMPCVKWPSNTINSIITMSNSYHGPPCGHLNPEIGVLKRQDRSFYKPEKNL